MPSSLIHLGSPSFRGNIDPCKCITLMGILLSIHYRAYCTGCTNMPPFDRFRCPTLEATQIHVSASHSWGYFFAIHSRASYTGCTDMPPYDPYRCATLEATQIHVSASHSWGYSSRYTLVHLIQDALICLHLIHLAFPLQRQHRSM